MNVSMHQPQEAQMDCNAAAISKTLKDLEILRTELQSAENAEATARGIVVRLSNRVRELQKMYDQQIAVFKKHPSMRNTDWWAKDDDCLRMAVNK